MTLAANPLLARSELPFQLPPFEAITPEHYLPAFEHGMAEQVAEIELITSNPDAPSLANTIGALERTGETLTRVEAVFSNLASSDTNDEIQAIETEVSPKLTAYRDSIYLNAALWARVKAVYQTRDQLSLDAEGARLVERYHTDFVRAGADLDPHIQNRLREINEELSSLSTAFQQRLLADTNTAALIVDDASDLAGLSDDAIASAAAAAESRGVDGKYVLNLVLPTGQPALTSLTNRAVRERLFNASIDRGRRGNDHDTSEIATSAVRLRAERARLLGYPDHATYILADRTAENPERLDAMLTQLVPPAIANATAEARALQSAIDGNGAEHELAPWDWAFYSERARKAQFDIDAGDLRPYFELNRVLHDGVFHAANRLYGLTFSEREDLVGYHPDVRVFEVFNEDGSPRTLPRRLLRSPVQARRCLDEQLGRAVGSARNQAGRRQQPQHSKATGRRAGIADVRRGQHGIPRVRTRIAWPVLRRHLSKVLRHERLVGLRRVPISGQRDVGGLARGVVELRQALPDRRAAPPGVARAATCVAAVGRRLQDHGVSRCNPPGPSLAPACARRRDRRCRRVRGAGAR